MYPPEVILFMLILKNICNIKTMRDMTRDFNKEECIENIKWVLGLEILEDYRIIGKY